MSVGFTVSSDHTLKGAITWLTESYKEHKRVTLTAAFGESRSMDQNALFHVWLTEYIAYKLRIDKRDVTKAHKAGIKRTVKRSCYLDTSWPWMIHEITDYNSGATKKDFTSSKDWERGEMYMVLNWFQMQAAEDGCILEAKGQFAKPKRESGQ